MKHVVVFTAVFLLAACGEGTPVTTTPETSEPAEQLVEEAQDNGNGQAASSEEEAITTEQEVDLFVGASTAIDALTSWDSYHSVKRSEHIVHTNPANSYAYEETLFYVKEPHASHLIYKSDNPVYMEIYANEQDGMFANDDEFNSNWTYTTDADTIEMWQEDRLPHTQALLHAIAEEHTKFTIVDEGTQTVEYFVQTPTSAIDDLLFGEDGDHNLLTDVTLTLTYIDAQLEAYEIVGNYKTQQQDEGQFVVNETFQEVNNLQSLRVPEDVKAQAVLEDYEFDWHE